MTTTAQSIHARAELDASAQARALIISAALRPQGRLVLRLADLPASDREAIRDHIAAQAATSGADGAIYRGYIAPRAPLPRGWEIVFL